MQRKSDFATLPYDGAMVWNSWDCAGGLLLGVADRLTASVVQCFGLLIGLVEFAGEVSARR